MNKKNPGVIIDSFLRVKSGDFDPTFWRLNQGKSGFRKTLKKGVLEGSK